MIATVSSSDLSWLIWEFVVSALAGLGGLIVWRGLWLEKHSKPSGELYSNLADFWRGKSREKSGENWVIAGIVVEIIIAVSLAAIDGWNIHKANANAPENLPVTSIEAQVFIEVKGTNFLFGVEDEQKIAQMATHLEIMDKSGGILVRLPESLFVCQDSRFGAENEPIRIFFTKFNWPDVNKFWVTRSDPFSRTNLTVSDFDKDVGGVFIVGPEFMGDKRMDEKPKSILAGSGLLMVNGWKLMPLSFPSNTDDIFLITNRP